VDSRLTTVTTTWTESKDQQEGGGADAASPLSCSGGRVRHTGPVETIVKRRADAPEGFFEAEAAGLAWLAAAGGARTVDVVAVSPGRIELERVDETRPDRHAAEAFGAALARTHAAGARAFGAGPDGWDGPLFIGRRPLPAADEPTWGAFYVRDRVLPYLEIAEEVGNTTSAEGQLVRRAANVIAAGAFDDDEAPARIHGDLWNGNMLWSVEGVVLIDPAAHGGHRETDLAMLALFGCPFLAEVLAAYDRAAPLRDGWRERVPLHQLHPLAVHAAGHGRNYGMALAEAAEAVLALG
jgi:fructosamine-3-kinase